MTGVLIDLSSLTPDNVQVAITAIKSPPTTRLPALKVLARAHYPGIHLIIVQRCVFPRGIDSNTFRAVKLQPDANSHGADGVIFVCPANAVMTFTLSPTGKSVGRNIFIKPGGSKQQKEIV